MFKKLLSNLPYNPSLIGQVSFYAQRVHRESVIRRSGMIMISLALALQTFAVLSPPEASLQASPNTDLINGGFNSKQEAVNHCRNNTQDYKKIMANFGISCENISDASVTNISPRDNDSKLYSMGRLAYGVAGETPVRIPEAGTFYVRHFWSLNHEPSYKALKLKNSQGKVFYILFGCGNIVSIGIPVPVPPVDVCENVPGQQTKKEECDVCPETDGIQTDKSKCDVCPNISGTQTNTADCDKCPNVAGTQDKKKECDVCPDKPGIQKTLQECDVCPNTPGVQTNTNQCDVCPEVDGVQTNTADCVKIVDVCPDIDGIQTNENECKPCENSQTKSDLTACLEYKKSAVNLTKSSSDANGTTASPGDVIEYTLTTTNVGKLTIKDYVVNEGLSDVLDYADVVDLHGGVKGAYDNVSWPKEDIKATESSVHKITVKIKDVLPQTPASSSDPQHFDMVMTNVYGNAVTINLPPNLVKRTEIAVTTLPNTGPGTSLMIGFSLALFIGYFFARSRLLAKELDVVRADFGSVGGY